MVLKIRIINNEFRISIHEVIGFYFISTFYFRHSTFNIFIVHDAPVQAVYEGLT
jgi:hypothetical protein